jgi:hypothetical protein
MVVETLGKYHGGYPSVSLSAHSAVAHGATKDLRWENSECFSQRLFVSISRNHHRTKITMSIDSRLKIYVKILMIENTYFGRCSI